MTKHMVLHPEDNVMGELYMDCQCQGNRKVFSLCPQVLPSWTLVSSGFFLPQTRLGDDPPQNVIESVPDENLTCGEDDPDEDSVSEEEYSDEVC